MKELRDLVRDIPDFPKPGILYRDITPLLENPRGLRTAVRAMVEPFRGNSIDRVLGIESRGFLFGVPIAIELQAGFAAVRKPGKLPHDTHCASYGLEYGSDELHMHVDSVEAGQRVLLVDDLIATGGTAAAAVDLVARAGGRVVGCSFLVELKDLDGVGRLEALGVGRVHSVIGY